MHSLATLRRFALIWLRRPACPWHRLTTCLWHRLTTCVRDRLTTCVRLRLPVLFLLALAPAVALAQPAAAQDEWLTPAIPGHGGVRHYPDAAQQLAPNTVYRLVFDVTGANSSDAIVPALDTLARFLNLASLAGVPAQNLQLAAVFHGPATDAVMNDAAYDALYGRANPNLPLLRQLKAAGVRLYVCAQALARQELDQAQVAPEVEVAEAALTVLANLQMAGYGVIGD